MAAEADHIALANRNHSLLLHLIGDVDKYPDWVATIGFYKAVHVVEAVFATDKGWHSTTHDDREEKLKWKRYKNIFIPYTHLKTASVIARYLECRAKGKFTTFEDFLTGKGVKTLMRKKLHAVEQSALPLLSPDGQASLVKVNPPDFR